MKITMKNVKTMLMLFWLQLSPVTTSWPSRSCSIVSADQIEVGGSFSFFACFGYYAETMFKRERFLSMTVFAELDQSVFLCERRFLTTGRCQLSAGDTFCTFLLQVSSCFMIKFGKL